MTTTETTDTGPESFYVQSPKGNIYKVSAQGRSDLVARGYRDITAENGAEKFADQNKADERQATASTSTEAAPARPAPAQARRAPGAEQTSAGPPSQNTEDAKA